MVGVVAYVGGWGGSRRRTRMGVVAYAGRECWREGDDIRGAGNCFLHHWPVCT